MGVLSHSYEGSTSVLPDTLINFGNVDPTKAINGNSHYNIVVKRLKKKLEYS